MSNTTVAAGAHQARTFFRVDDFLIELREVHGLKISKSTFLNGVRSGKFPQPLRLSVRRPVWKNSDIATLIASF